MGSDACGIGMISQSDNKGQGQDTWVVHNSKLYCETSANSTRGHMFVLERLVFSNCAKTVFTGRSKLQHKLVLCFHIALGHFPFAHCWATLGKTCRCWDKSPPQPWLLSWPCNASSSACAAFVSVKEGNVRLIRGTLLFVVK